MRGGSVFVRLLGLGRAVVEGVRIEEGVVVVEARPGRRERSRCGICGRRSPGYDGGEGRRRWRALDLGATRAFVEAKAPRVACKRHGVVVVRVPWARHGSRFTRPFEAQVAWLASYCSKSAVCELMRVSWLSVGRMIERVVADEQAKRGDRLERLRRIGIDELSYRKGQRYITGVVDHDTGRLVWAADGRDKKTVASFFAELGPKRTGRIELVSSDMGEWITRVVARECPQATLCLDPFHVVKLASAALDEVRREVWNDARRAGHTVAAKDLKGARYALWKNPENLTDRQVCKLADIQKTNKPLYRAYLLDDWIAWARRCRLAPFVKLAKTITKQRAGIIAAIKHGLSNARVEAINTQIRMITRRAFGFHSPAALIALAMLSLSGLCPALPR